MSGQRHYGNALFLLLFTCGLLLPSQATAKEKLYWLEAVAPPFFIHEGPLAGQGYEDLITDILEEKMPQFEHVHMQATISRHYQQWKQGENACSLAMYKTPERDEFVYFSKASVFTLPPVLIIQKDRFEDFGGQKVVRLADLLKEGKMVIGRSKNRSYGPGFDKSLNDYGNDKNIYAYEGPELTLNLFKMLLAGRVDALPGLPEEAMYLAETMGFRDKIMTISVSENLEDRESMLTYVACSKTDWGKNTIETINTILTQERPTERYRAAYERWLDPSSVGEYRKMYKEIFLQQD
ncbi:TIGR02285 family protein [Desulfopila aestuarii]|uniref:Uncharacterized protein n=1 Tax=Desulfopila aestuarii DSM 18488 TaxID=1121416 RepID=A0A1M7XWF1_9BACT|nr:TIGR02285 family protein [Desulfopila aestuarii]SHO43084.1 conserved hypothetical protein [Desulfopila aestuarii DSM 18488]